MDPTFLLSHQLVGARPQEASQLWMIAHGIFGSARNWRTFARSLSERRPDLAIVAVDLRQHGDSIGAPPPHTLSACGADLARLATYLGRSPEVLVGHSFGGKVVLAAIAEFAQRPQSVFVLDCPIGAANAETRAPLASEVGRMIGFLERYPLPVPRRSQVTEALIAEGFSRGVAGWMATNLEADASGGFRWHFDQAGVRELLEDYWCRDFYPLVERPDPSWPTLHFVHGTRSDRWEPLDLERLARACDGSRAHLHPLRDAAHWVHVDQPAALLQLLLDHAPPIAA